MPTSRGELANSLRKRGFQVFADTEKEGFWLQASRGSRLLQRYILLATAVRLRYRRHSTVGDQ